MRDADGNPHGGTDFHVMPQGAGGFNICGAQSSDGATFANGVDVYGMYIRQAGGTFVPMTCEAGMPNFLTTDAPPLVSSFFDFPGTKGLAFAQTLPTRLYFWSYNAVWRVDNANAAQPTAALTALKDKTVTTNNGNSRGWNPIIAVKYDDEDTFIAGTYNNGVYYSEDAGATVHAVTIGANATYGDSATPYLVAFNPLNGHVYIQRQGTGLHRSTTGVSGSFSLMSGSPTYAWTLFVDVDGVVWVCDPTHASGCGLNKYNGSWSGVTMAVNQANPKIVAVNPLNTDQIVTADDWINDFQHSTDGGANFLYFQSSFPAGTGIAISETVPWQVGETIQISQMWFDPVVDGKLWCSHGAGLAYSFPPTDDGTPWQWHGESLGMECQVGENTLSVPGGGTLFLSMDTAIWNDVPSVDSIAKEPINPANSTFICNAWAADYAADNNDYIAVAGSNASGDVSGYSENGVAGPWHTFFPGAENARFLPTGEPGGFGGMIAVNEQANQILVPGSRQKAIYTLNEWGRHTGTMIRGVDWEYLDPTGENPSGLSDWIAAYYTRWDRVTPDKTVPLKFALTMSGEGDHAPYQGLWVTTDGGVTFTQTVEGVLDATGDPLGFGDGRLSYIPGKTGELLYADKGNPGGCHLIHYTNDGLSGPTNVGGITYINWFNFGMACPGQSYPTVFFHGTVGGVLGVYRSHDFFATTPTLLAQRPLGSFDGISNLGGDMNVWGRPYIPHTGTGFSYGIYHDRATAT